MIADSWVENPEKLPEVTRDIEATDCYHDLSRDAEYSANYYARPIISHKYPDIEVRSSINAISESRNLTMEVVDTSMATTCRDIHQSVIPVGGDGETKTNCETLTRLSDGINEVSGFSSVARKVALDARLNTVGALMYYVYAGELKCERMLRGSVLWRYTDEEEPSMVYTQRAINRRRLARMFPAFKEKIMSAAVKTWSVIPRPGVDPVFENNDDTIRVFEAWDKAERKISGDGIHPGRHVVAIDGAVLLNKPWELEFTPIVFTKWADGPRGLAGRSMASMLAKWHWLSNWIIHNLLEGARGNSPKIFVPEGERVSQLADMAWQVAKYSGMKPPQFALPNGISPQLIDLLKMIESFAYKEVGTSESIGASTRPTGLNSEPSQLAWLDIANVRSFDPQKRWEKFHTDCMRVKMGMAMNIYRDKDVRVMAPGTKMIDLIRWPKDFGEDKYSYKATVASGLPPTLSGKIQAIQQIKAIAPTAFSEQEVLRGLDMPDVDSARDDVLAPLTFCEEIIGAALKDGKFIPPSRIQGVDGLQLLVRKISQRYQLEMVQSSYPAAHLEVLRRVLLATEKMLGIVSTQGHPQTPLTAPVPAPQIAPVAPVQMHANAGAIAQPAQIEIS